MHISSYTRSHLLLLQSINMLCLRDVNFRDNSDSSILGILHNLPSICLSVVPVTFIIARCHIWKAGKSNAMHIIDQYVSYSITTFSVYKILLSSRAY